MFDDFDCWLRACHALETVAQVRHSGGDPVRAAAVAGAAALLLRRLRHVLARIADHPVNQVDDLLYGDGRQEGGLDRRRPARGTSGPAGPHVRHPCRYARHLGARSCAASPAFPGMCEKPIKSFLMTASAAPSLTMSPVPDGKLQPGAAH